MKARWDDASSLPCVPAAHSRAPVSRLPRNRVAGSRWESSHSRAASSSCRWARSQSRSASIQAGQPRPGGDQGLVAELVAVQIGGDQTPLDERIQHRFGLRGLLRGGQPTSGGHPVLADRDQTQEQGAGQRRGGGVECQVGPLGALGDGAVDAAGGQVGRHAQRAAAALGEGAQQGMREQRQRSGLMVAQEQLDQAVLDLDPGPPRRFDDGAAQFVAGHRPDQYGRLAQRAEQHGVTHGPVVEVGPQREQHGAAAAGRLGEGLDRGSPCGIRHGRGEHLLELVHDEDAAGAETGQRLGDRPLRVRAGRGQRVRLGAQPGQHPGAQDGGLAAAGGAHHHDHDPSGGPRGDCGAHLGHQPVPAEEPLGVLDLETGQTLVRGALLTGLGCATHPAQCLVPGLDLGLVVDPADPQQIGQHLVRGDRWQVTPAEVPPGGAGTDPCLLRGISNCETGNLAKLSQSPGEFPSAGYRCRVWTHDSLSPVRAQQNSGSGVVECISRGWLHLAQSGGRHTPSRAPATVYSVGQILRCADLAAGAPLWGAIGVGHLGEAALWDRVGNVVFQICHTAFHPTFIGV